MFPIFPTQVLEDDTQNGSLLNHKVCVPTCVLSSGCTGTEVVLSEAEKCRLEQLLGHDEDYVEAEVRL